MIHSLLQRSGNVFLEARVSMHYVPPTSGYPIMELTIQLNSESKPHKIRANTNTITKTTNVVWVVSWFDGQTTLRICSASLIKVHMPCPRSVCTAIRPANRHCCEYGDDANKQRHLLEVPIANYATRSATTIDHFSQSNVVPTPFSAPIFAIS